MPRTPGPRLTPDPRRRAQDAISVESGLDLLAQLCSAGDDAAGTTTGEGARRRKRKEFQDFVTDEEQKPTSSGGAGAPRRGLEQLLQAVDVDIDAHSEGAEQQLPSPVIDNYNRGARSKRARGNSANAAGRDGSPGPQSSGTMFSGAMPDSPRAVNSTDGQRPADSPLLSRLRHSGVAKKRTSAAGAAEAMLLMGMAAGQQPKASRLRNQSHHEAGDEEDGSGDPEPEYRPHHYTRADGKICANCGVIDTPCWRKFGDLDMCNACGGWRARPALRGRPPPAAAAGAGAAAAAVLVPAALGGRPPAWGARGPASRPRAERAARAGALTLFLPPPPRPWRSRVRQDARRQEPAGQPDRPAASAARAAQAHAREGQRRQQREQPGGGGGGTAQEAHRQGGGHGGQAGRQACGAGAPLPGRSRRRCLAPLLWGLPCTPARSAPPRPHPAC